MHVSERPSAPRCARVRLLWAVLCGVWFLAMAAVHAQQAGSVDPSFGASLGLAGNVRTIFVQPDGKILVSGIFSQRIVRLNADGSVDASFTPAAGIDSIVEAAAVQSDGKVVIIGGFTSVGGVGRYHIARLNADGSLDTSFDPGTGPNAGIYTLAVQADDKVIIGGGFTSVNGMARNDIARLNTDGGVDTSFDPGTGANGGVYAVVIQADKVFIGGGFTQMNGITRNRVARLNANGSVDMDFDPGVGPNQPLYAVAVQTSGKVVIGGLFTTVDGVTRNRIARLDASGGLDTGFDPGTGVNDAVKTVAVQADDKVLAGGYFTSANGTARNHVARFNSNGVLDTGFNPGTVASTFVASVAVQADKVFIAGPFTSVGGTVSNGVTRLNSDGSVDGAFRADVAGGPNNVVYSVATQTDGKVIVYGPFTSVDGVARNSIARLNADGSLDASFDPGMGPNDFVSTVAVQASGKVVIGGYFTSVNGVARSHVAQLNVDGSVDTSFDPSAGPNDIVNSVAVQTDGKVIIGGNFTSVNGTARNYIARLNTNGKPDTAFNPGTGASSAVGFVAVQADGNVFIYGGFTSVNGKPRKNFARLNTNGGVDTGFVPGAGPNGGAYALAVQADGKVIFGGYFFSVNGVTRNYIARLNADGSLDTGFDPGVGPSSTVNSVAVQADGKVVIGGLFTTVDGMARNRVARLNTDGGVDMDFDPGAGPNSTLRTLRMQADGKAVIGGDFIRVGGVVRNYVARLNSDGSVDPDFVSGGVPRIEAIVLQAEDNMVVVGGIFTNVGGGPANALARLRADGSLDPSFVAPFSLGDQVPALARQPSDGKLLISHVPLSQTKIKNPIIRCNGTNGNPDASFSANAGTNGTAFALAVQTDTANAGKVVVGGSFTQLNSTVGHTNLGRLNANGTLDASFTTVTNNTVEAVIAQADGSLMVGGVFTTVNGTAHARLARLAANGTPDANFTMAIPNGQVAALAQQSNGLLMVGGSFTVTTNGVTRSCLVRLKTDGTLDTAFNAGTFALGSGTGLVSSIIQQPDGKLVVVGSFDHVNGVIRPNVVRLTTTGGVDTTYNPGTGTDAPAYAVALQTDGKTILGGDFTTVDGLGRAGVARLFGDYNLDDYPPLGQWRIINFNQPANTGNAADTATPFGDGVPNLVKYALNLNPQAADATPMTATGTKGLPLLGKDGSGRYLTLTFVRRQAGTSPGVSYLVEFSGSLVNPAGFAVNASATSKATTLDAIWERVTVTDSVTISSQPLGRFARLRVTDP